MRSEFAGAAHQMRQAVLVNPFDVHGLQAAIDEAVNGDRRQHRRRMASLRRGVHRDDAAWWAEPDVAHAAEQMLASHAAAGEPAFLTRLQAPAEHVFSPARVGALMRERLMALYGSGGPA